MTKLSEPMLTPGGRVTLSGPDSKGYYRIRWHETVGGVKTERSTTATRNLEDATRRARVKEEELLSGATERTRSTMADAIAYWLDPTTPRPRDRAWAKSRLANAQHSAEVLCPHG